MNTISYTELESEIVEVLPEKETLSWSSNYAWIYASNSALALNAATLGSAAVANAGQAITVVQS
jgi:hypothetical protein